MGLSLILPIGAQNSFVLKQGLKQQHVFWICLVCAVSDAILILIGVMGFGSFILQYPVITLFAQYVGAVFLFIYGALHLKSALTVSQHMQLDQLVPTTLLKTFSLCIALTWLNPHVYLDTVVLLGSVSVQFHVYKIYFALGAMTASFIFFFGLGYGARYLLLLFKNSRAWQILDFVIAMIMWWIAFLLIQ